MCGSLGPCKRRDANESGVVKLHACRLLADENVHRVVVTRPKSMVCDKIYRIGFAESVALLACLEIILNVLQCYKGNERPLIGVNRHGGTEEEN